MAAIHDLLAQVSDENLRSRLEQEFNKISKTKKFGLVFEEHIPECTPLYDVVVKRGATVAKKDGPINDVYVVSLIKKGNAVCIHKADNEIEEIEIENLVPIAQFGDPIYPTLRYLDSVENAPDSDLWHTLIEADNYHALQLLEYLYAGKVDCIYIDPPYNKPDSKDWKYNCNYVDGSDSYRHSKWLSMMKKRLIIAKKLLNPSDSVLIVTIDELEYLHLGCLLEELFPDARIQMVSDVINPRGTTRDGQFSRSDEYLFLVQLGINSVSYPKKDEKHYVEWYRLRRTDYESRRGTTKGGTQQFYPIYIDEKTEKIVKIGEPLQVGQDRNCVPNIDGAIPVFPIKNDGTEMNWGVTPETLKLLIDNHFVRVRKNAVDKHQPYLIHYISYKMLEAIDEGRASIEGYNDDGTAIVVEEEGHVIRPGTAWNVSSHNAGTYGTEILANVIGEKRFTFPKSLYSVADVLRYYLRNKPNALVVDFFAGSGTTLHAINLLNVEDNGKRRCIMVTNNEVSYSEAKTLTETGFHPGDEEWNQLGIARHVTWPRTVCSIKGSDVKGRTLAGEYGVLEEIYTLDEDIAVISKRTGKPTSQKVYVKKKEQKYPQFAGKKYADGFKTNAIFFSLSFLDKNKVVIGQSFFDLIPILWMKAGAIGRCPEFENTNKIPDTLVLQKNHFAVLANERYFLQFQEEVNKHPEIDTVYIVTDSENGFREMISGLNAENTYQLYRDYLDNFKINIGR